MTSLEALLLFIFLVILVTWVAMSSYVLLDRAAYEIREGPMRTVRFRLRDPALQALPPDERVRRVERELARVSRRRIDRLAADLSVPGWEVQTFATYALKKWGRERLAKDAWAHRGTISKWRRVAALRILAHAGYPDILTVLERAIRERDPDVVGMAITLLGRVSDLRAARLLVRALRTHAYSPSRIASVLEQFPLEILHLLRPLLADPDPVVRLWAATLVARYPVGDDLDAELAVLVDDPDPRVRKAAIQTLAKIRSPRAASAATKLLSDAVWYVRAHAIQAIGHLGRVDLVQHILPALADRQWWIRVAAKQSLEALGPAVWPQVVPYLDHPDAFARDGAAEVLQNLGILDTLAVEVATRGADPDTVSILRKALSTGGVWIMDALVERTDATTRPRLRQLLEALDLQAARSV